MSVSPRGLRAWLRWEFGRRIEVTGVIKFIIAERFVKGSALAVGGLTLFVLSSDGFVSNLATQFQDQLNLNPGSGFFHGLWVKVVVKFGNFGTVERDAIAVGAFAYGTLEVLEGVGLLLRRRWAEYLVLLATVAFIPLEIDEVMRHLTVVKLLAFVVNIAIVVYLIWRKRLFLERPGEPPVADRTQAEPKVG